MPKKRDAMLLSYARRYSLCHLVYLQSKLLRTWFVLLSFCVHNFGGKRPIPRHITSTCRHADIYHQSPCFYPFRTTNSLSLISEKTLSKDRWYARNSHLPGGYYFLDLLHLFVAFQKCAFAFKYFHDKDPPPGDKG